ncbi:transposase [Salmonella enterica]|uniref:Transposase n=1 Tax=Salmonella enterica TaxID=28901 RepID=A0A5Y9Q6D1_SALER|nr:transposase [Salmonella enterica]EBW4116942.1 transposase [Salmonella enterica subsp. enterica serovar Oranienburg]ECG1308595.1 transposase [Salmonella enterica subsp. diarizonae]EED8464476.1 transposase [Salmonella enterica subsp. diarizonae serovar 61:i:z53]EIG1170700.1 transposase [Salmonella enterica subsp. diarizonae serovar 48:k:z53]
MESQSWRKESRKIYSNDFKLRIVELASRPDACIAQIARENGINDNVIFKLLRLWQKEGRVSRRLPATIPAAYSVASSRVASQSGQRTVALERRSDNEIIVNTALNDRLPITH